MGLLKQGFVVVLAVVLYSSISRLFTKTLPPNFGGKTHPDFQLVADVFRANVESGKEPGGALAVYYKGQLVVDLWGGYADVSAERPWREDTVTQAFSCTKGIAAIIVAKLVQLGMLDYSKLVSDYWPDFAQNGKANVTVEMLLSHQAGLSSLDEPVSIADLKENLDKVTDRLGRQKPMWPPGTQFGYHTLTYGLYVDRLIQMADKAGRDTETIFQEEIAKPLGIDFHMNLPLRDFHRTARMEAPSEFGFLYQAAVYARQHLTTFLYIAANPQSLMAKSVGAIKGFSITANMFNDPANRDVTISSLSGTGTARGLAKVYGALANGGAMDGREILPRDLVNRLTTVVVSGQDSVLVADGVKFGPGTLFLKDRGEGGPVVGHTGHGGQVAFADLKNKLGVGYLTNHLTVFMRGDDPRYLDLKEALDTCLKNTKL